MANSKLSALAISSPRGTPDRANDIIYVEKAGVSYGSTVNNELGISGNPVGDTDSQTLTNKTLTSPAISGPTLSGTLTGTYTLGGTPTFPASVVTLTGSQTLTNKVLTSPTISAPTITNASITADAVTGFTSANNGTIYGVGVTAGVITSASVGTSSIVTGAQFVQKTQNPYKFSAYRNAAWNTGTGSQYNAVALDTVTFDTGSNFNTSTNRFIAPIAGFYFFAGTVSTSTTNVWLIAGLMKNGTIVKKGQGNLNAAGAINSSNTVSGLIQLVVSDYVQIALYSNTATQGGLIGADTTFLDGFLVSAT